MVIYCPGYRDKLNESIRYRSAFLLAVYIKDKDDPALACTFQYTKSRYVLPMSILRLGQRMHIVATM